MVRRAGYRRQCTQRLVHDDGRQCSCNLSTLFSNRDCLFFDTFAALCNSFDRASRANNRYCSKCKAHREATKKLDIWSLPPVLIVHLKRFQLVNGRWTKSQRHVKCPVHALDVFSTLAPPLYVEGAFEAEEARLAELARKKAAEKVTGGAGSAEVLPEQKSQRDADVVSSAPPSLGGGKMAGSEQSADELPARADPARPSDDGPCGVRAATDGGAGPAGSEQAGVVRWDKLDPHANFYHNPSEPRIYDLSSMSIHLGVMGGGHYVAYSKNRNDKWLVLCTNMRVAMNDNRYFIEHCSSRVSHCSIPRSAPLATNPPPFDPGKVLLFVLVSQVHLSDVLPYALSHYRYYYNDSSCREVTEEQLKEENPYCLFFTARGLDVNQFLPNGAGSDRAPESPAPDEDDPDPDSDGNGEGSGRSCIIS